MNCEKVRRKIPDIVLEQYRLGELSRPAMAEVRKRLAEDTESRVRLAFLEESDREILGQYHPKLMARAISTRLESKGTNATRNPKSPQVLKWSLGIAAAFLVLILFAPSVFTPWEGDQPLPMERLKGEEAHLNLYRKTPNGSDQLEDLAIVFEGDVLRIGYQARGRSYGVILSVDGRGKVTQHLPSHGSRSAPLSKDGEVLLDFALELDDAPRWERFFFVTSEKPFDLAAVVLAAGQVDTERPAESSQTLDLPSGLEQFTLSLVKGVGR